MKIASRIEDVNIEFYKGILIGFGYKDNYLVISIPFVILEIEFKEKIKKPIKK